MKIGALTIGQAPRNDIMDEMRPLLGENVEILQAGILDGMTRAQIGELAPSGNEYSLVARLSNGDSALLAKERISPLVQQKVIELNGRGAALIVLLCAGVFAEVFSSDAPVIQPVEMLYAIVPMLTSKSRIIDVLPDASQQRISTENWLKRVKGVDTVIASPHSGNAQLLAAANKARDMEGDLIVLDGIAFTMETKKLFEEHTGKPVILPKSLVARVICELGR